MAGSDEVRQMKDIDEEDGSLLDISMVFFQDQSPLAGL